ncbi:MAG: hypothetical protein LM580_00465 [Thermofilum sp.]|nr:hypothetical protein [Thermofilum sp.]
MPLEVLRPGKADFEGVAQAPSIIVWVDGGTAYAKDGRTGRIVAGPSTDHAAVLQAAIDYVGRKNARVHLKGALYIRKRIDLGGSWYLRFTGESNGATKLVIDTSESAVIDISGSAYITFDDLQFYIPPGRQPSYIIFASRKVPNGVNGGYVFRNIKVHDEGGADVFYYGYGSEGVLFDTCWIDIAKRGIVFTACNIDNVSTPFTSPPPPPQSQTHVAIRDGHIVNWTKNPCVELEGTAQMRIEGVYFGCDYYDPTNYAIRIRWHPQKNIPTEEISIENNMFEKAVVAGAQPVPVGSVVFDLTIRKNRIAILRTGPIVDFSASPTGVYGFVWDENNTMIPGHELRFDILADAYIHTHRTDPTKEPKVVVTGSVRRTVIDAWDPANVVLPTEKIGVVEVITHKALSKQTGAATIPAGQTSVTVAHSLRATPSKVLVTPTANIGAVWVSNVTSTSFTINCSTTPAADTIVYWYAEV